MSSELATLSAYFWFILFMGFILLLLTPFLIWKNTASTLTLLRHVLEEQERTNDLLALQLKQNEEAMGLMQSTLTAQSEKKPTLATETDTIRSGQVSDQDSGMDFTLEEE